MQKEPIVVIAEPAGRPFYEALQVEGERLELHAPGEAWDSVTGWQAGVVILDCGMDGEQGVELLRAVKRGCPTVPVIFLADASSEELVIKAFKAGAREYFKKPVSMAELSDTVTKLLRLRRGVSETRESLQQHVGQFLSETGLPFTTDLPEGVLRTLRYLAENLFSELYLDNLAREAGMSKYHFCRVFKRNLGTTPMQFLAALRIERAKLMLRKPDLTIATVAFRVGFNDISDFIRQFKKQTGVTPTAYKETLRKVPPFTPII